MKYLKLDLLIQQSLLLRNSAVVVPCDGSVVSKVESWNY